MQQILNVLKSSSVSAPIIDKSCSYSEKESILSVTSIEFDLLFDQDEQIDSIDATPILNPHELFYDIQAKNFGADQVGHTLDEK